MVVRKRMRLTENQLLYFCAVMIVIIMIAIIIMTQTEFELYVPLVFGSFFGVFVLEKILLGDSLKFIHLTVPSFFIVLYIILMSFPSMLVFSEMHHPIRYTYFMAVQSVLITFPIGVGLANLMVHNPSKVIRNYLYSKLEKTQADFKFLSLFKALLIFSFPILAIYFLYSEHAQLLVVIKAYPTNIEAVALRFAENELPKGIHFLFELLRRFILPICVLYAYFMSRVYKSKWKHIFWILFSVTLVVSSLTLDRAPVVALLITMIVAYLLARNLSIFKAFNIKLMIILIIAVTMGGFISVFQYQTAFKLETAIANSWYVLSYRIIQDPSFMASLAFMAFNNQSSFLHGKHVRLFSLLPGFVYAESLSDDIHPMSAAPVSFVGDLWRNWSWPGVIVGTICIGFAYQLIQLKLFRRKSVISLTIQTILLIGSVWIIYGNALGIMSTSVLFFGVLFGLLLCRSSEAS